MAITAVLPKVSPSHRRHSSFGATNQSSGRDGTSSWASSRSDEANANANGGAGGLYDEKEDCQPQHHERPRFLTFKQRIKHFSWAWFCLTMATGGIANVVFHIPFRFPGLYAIGCIFFLLNIALFVANVTLISMRFYLYKGTFTSSLVHPTESLFVPASIISVGTILINITEYGVVSGKAGEWLVGTMLGFFWLYCGLATLFSLGIYLIIWTSTHFTIQSMTPVWIFPAYPLLLVGPMASVMARVVEGDKALQVIVGGFVYQGIGFMVSLMIYAAYIYRLMTQKLPQEPLRPAMFISVGPSGFTISGIVNMGQRLPHVVSDSFMGNGQLAGEVSRIAATWVGLWLWGLAFWFFFVAVAAHQSTIRHGRMTFAMTWYSYVFPNSALTTATFAIANALDDNNAIRIVGCVMAGLLVLTWILVFAKMIHAVVVQEILWPQKQEDRDEGGWKAAEVRENQADRLVGPKSRRQLGPASTEVPPGIRLTEVAERIIDQAMTMSGPQTNVVKDAHDIV